MQDIKKSSRLILYYKSGRELTIENALTNNYIQLINWLFSNDDIPFKVDGKDDTAEDIIKTFILYKDSIESIEVVK